MREVDDGSSAFRASGDECLTSDADDREVWPLGSVHADPLADGVTLGPRALRELLANYRNVRRSLLVGHREVATAHEWDLQRREIARSHRVEIRIDTVSWIEGGLLARSPGLDDDLASDDPFTERDLVRKRQPLNAGNRGNTFLEIGRASCRERGEI